MDRGGTGLQVMHPVRTLLALARVARGLFCKANVRICGLSLLPPFLLQIRKRKNVSARCPVLPRLPPTRSVCSPPCMSGWDGGGIILGGRWVSRWFGPCHTRCPGHQEVDLGSAVGARRRSHCGSFCSYFSRIEEKRFANLGNLLLVGRNSRL